MTLRFQGLGESHEMNIIGQPKVMWYTPQIYIDAAREVMGDIDLDPATDERVQKRIKAKKYYTVHSNGLIHNWRGRVWLNSPYEPKLLEFAKKALDEYKSGRVTEMIFLTHTEATYSSWFQKLGEASTVICFHKNRIKWIGDHTAYMQKDNEKPKEVHINDENLTFDADYSIHGSVFFYFGKNPMKFCKIFRKWGFCKS